MDADKCHEFLVNMGIRSDSKLVNLECGICKEKQGFEIFIPCGHFCCSDCIQKINQCHICRQHITSHVTLKNS